MELIRFFLLELYVNIFPAIIIILNNFGNKFHLLQTSMAEVNETLPIDKNPNKLDPGSEKENEQAAKSV